MLAGGHVVRDISDNAEIAKFETIEEGDAVLVHRKQDGMLLKDTYKEALVQGWVTKRVGMRVKIMPEDRSAEFWIALDSGELNKVTPGGGLELQEKARKIEEARLAEEEKKRKAAEYLQNEANEKEMYEEIQKKRLAKIEQAILARSVPAAAWMPVGIYNWVESPVLMDQTKDCYRIVWYEISTDLDYGAKWTPPALDLGPVGVLKEAHGDRKAAEYEARKNDKKAKKPTDEEIAEQAAIDDAEIAALTKVQEELLATQMAEYEKRCKERKPVSLPSYPPENPPVLTPPEYPKNKALYEKLLAQGHAGDRVFYTDGSWHNNPYVIGSVDKMLKGGGQAKELAEMLGFQEKVITFKKGFDEGKTLVKHDCFPKEDPAEWITKDEPKFAGEFRKDEVGKNQNEVW